LKKILFRVNSSSNIGLGHLMRCLTLAKEYKDSKIYFACENLAGNFNQKVIEEGYSLKVLKSNDKKEFLKLIKKLKIDFIVIDNYDIDFSFEKYIKQNSKVKLLCFDDIYKKHYCDIVLNHNIYAKEEKYKKLVPSFCELRCGKKHTLIRDEFKKQKKVKKKNEIFVAMGGVDHLGLNPKIIDVLVKYFKKYRVNIITSSSNKNLKALKKKCSKYQNINLYIDSKKIAKLMVRSSFAIVTPSVTVHEVIYMNLDFIAIKTADNQRYMYKYLKKKKYKVLETFSNKKLVKLINGIKSESKR